MEPARTSTVAELSALYRVPRETWAEIFRLVCLSKDSRIRHLNSLHPKRPCWVLTSVCRDWRDLAESLPELWSRIRLHKKHPHLDYRDPVFYRRLQKTLFLSQARAASLDIKLSFQFERWSPGRMHSSGSTGLHQPILDLLLPHYKRWASVKIYDVYDFAMHVIMKYFWDTGNFTPSFERLEALGYSYPSDREGMSLSHNADIRPSFPALGSVSLGGNFSRSSMLAFFPFEALKNVEIRGEHRITELIPTLTSASRIALFFTNTPRWPPINPDPSQQLVLHQLTELVLHNWILPRPPSDFSAPNLRILKIDSLTERSALSSLTAFLLRSDCALHELYIHHLIGSTTKMRSLFQAVPNLPILHVGFGAEELPDSRGEDSDDDAPDMDYPLKHCERVANKFVRLLAQREDVTTLGHERSAGCQPVSFVVCPRLESLTLQLVTPAYMSRLHGHYQTNFDFEALAALVTKRWGNGRSGFRLQGNLRVEPIFKSITLLTSTHPSNNAIDAVSHLQELEGLHTKLLFHEGVKLRCSYLEDWMSFSTSDDVN